MQSSEREHDAPADADPARTTDSGQERTPRTIHISSPILGKLASGLVAHLANQGIKPLDSGTLTAPADDQGWRVGPVATIPLTRQQKTRLILNAVWPFGLAMVLLGVYIVAAIGRGAQGQPGMPLGVLLIFLAIGGAAVYGGILGLGRCRRDLRSGVVEIVLDRAIRSWSKFETSPASTSETSSRTYYTQFEYLGKIAVGQDVYEQTQHGGFFHLTYSAASKKLWHVDPASSMPNRAIP